MCRHTLRGETRMESMKVRDIAGDEITIYAVKWPEQLGGAYHITHILPPDRWYGLDYRSVARSTDLETAVKESLWSWNHNHPKMFDLQIPMKQAKIMAAVRRLFEPGTQGTKKRYSSYYLKHVIEHEIGEYVGNGEAKGAMLQAGFPLAKGDDALMLNCDFILKRLSSRKVYVE